MTMITPAGKENFNWSPKLGQELQRTASTDKNGKEEKTDKDFLYAAAKKILEAQGFDETELDETEDLDVSEENLDSEVDGLEEVDGSEEVDVSEEVDDSVEKADVQEAVAELVEKAEVADEMAESVSEALGNVEEAVEGVKDALGGDKGGESLDEVDVELPEEAIVEVDFEEEVESPCEEEVDSLCEEEVGGEDIILESDEGDLEASASSNDFVKISKISETTRKKVQQLWEKDLGYPKDYVKLMTTNFEK